MACGPIWRLNEAWMNELNMNEVMWRQNLRVTVDMTVTLKGNWKCTNHKCDVKWNFPTHSVRSSQWVIDSISKINTQHHTSLQVGLQYNTSNWSDSGIWQRQILPAPVSLSLSVSYQIKTSSKSYYFLMLLNLKVNTKLNINNNTHGLLLTY